MKKLFASTTLIFLIFIQTNYCVCAENINEISISASSSEELITKVREFVFEELDNQDTHFVVTVTGSALDEYTYNYLLNSKTEFESPLINDYMRTPGKDYNSLILREYSISKTVWNGAFEETKATKLKLDYTIKWDESAAEKEFVTEFAQSTTDDIVKEDDSDYQKIKTIHDFIVNRYSYDLSEDNEIHNPSQMILEETGVCSAYTGLMSQMLTSVGIENRIILINAAAKSGGSGQCHTWNLVKLNNNWYHVDVTWDDPVTGSIFQLSSHDYFLISDDSISSDHEWDKTVYPAAAFDYSKDSNVFAFTQVPESVDAKASITLNKSAQATFQSIKSNAIIFIANPVFWFIVFSVLFISLVIFRLLELIFHQE